MWSNIFNTFAFNLKFGIFPPNFKTGFIVIFSIVCHCVSNKCAFSYSMIYCAIMGDIWRTYNASIRALDSDNFIYYVDSKEPQIHKLWYFRIYGICCKVHPTARIQIMYGTSKEFVTDYLSERGGSLGLLVNLPLTAASNLSGFFIFGEVDC